MHVRRARKYGHPTQPAITTKQYKEEKLLVADLVNRNKAHHPGIESALDFFQQWIDKIADGKPVPAAKQITKAIYKRATPLDFLIEAASLQYYRELNPKAFKDDLSYTFAMGRAVMKLGSLKERKQGSSGKSYVLLPPGKEIKACGEYLIKSIQPLLLNISQAIASREAKEERRHRAMWQSFDHWPTP